MTLAVFLLGLGATARITRFFNADVLGSVVRIPALWLARGDDDHWLPYLLRCPWCASVWVAGGVYTAAYFYGHTAAFLIATSALCASFLVGLLADLLDPDEE